MSNQKPNQMPSQNRPMGKSGGPMGGPGRGPRNVFVEKPKNFKGTFKKLIKYIKFIFITASYFLIFLSGKTSSLLNLSINP